MPFPYRRMHARVLEMATGLRSQTEGDVGLLADLNFP